VRLYIDVETYRQRKEDAFTREKVIAIGVITDWTPYGPESAAVWDDDSVRFHYFTEWSLGGEAEVVQAFYDYLHSLVDHWRSGDIGFLNVVGFNTLRSDIPLLVQKGVEHGVGDLAELNRL